MDSFIARKRVNGKCTITEDEARFFFIQILDAVSHMVSCLSKYRVTNIVWCNFYCSSKLVINK